MSGTVTFRGYLLVLPSSLLKQLLLDSTCFWCVRSWFYGYLQFHRLQHIWHSSMPGTAMAHQIFFPAHQPGTVFRWHQLQRTRVQRHFIVVVSSSSLRHLLQQSVQVGPESWSDLPSHVCRLPHSGLPDRAQRFLRRQSAHLWSIKGSYFIEGMCTCLRMTTRSQVTFFRFSYVCFFSVGAVCLEISL